MKIKYTKCFGMSRVTRNGKGKAMMYVLLNGWGILYHAPVQYYCSSNTVVTILLPSLHIITEIFGLWKSNGKAIYNLIFF